MFSSGAFLICTVFFLLFGYVIAKHTLQPDGKPAAFREAHLDVHKDASTMQHGDTTLLHYDFHAYDRCAANLKNPQRKNEVVIDTFYNSGAVVKINLSALYSDSNNSRLSAVDVTYLGASKDCKVSVYMGQEQSLRSNVGCVNLETVSYLDITCETKSLLGSRKEKKSYGLMSKGLIDKYDYF